MKNLAPALAGAALALAVVALVSASPPQTASLVGLPPKLHVIVDGAFDPREAVVIEEGTPYVVPDGSLFVVTAFGGTRNPGNYRARVLFDLQLQAEVSMGYTDASTTMHSVPPGLVAASGVTVSVITESPLLDQPARAWGYLVRE